jgi:alpha-tubulin suppressor-like RCC1 family protein
LGTGSTSPTSSAVPVSVSTVTNAVSISLGSNHSCAVLATGTVVCWGLNSSGQLGDSSTTSRSTRVTVSGVTGASAISAGGTHTCAVLSTGTVRCWGSNSSGQLGNLSVASNSIVSVQVEGLDSSVRAIQTGTSSSCALLQTGSIQCWGAGARGELGNGLGSSSLAPVTVTGITNATALAMGGSTSCAILEDATVQCWGNGDFGKLGTGDTSSSSQSLLPVSVSGLTDAESISVGLAHVCAVTAFGVLKCWGRNNLGQLGNAGPAVSATPVNATRVLNGATTHRIGSRSSGKYLIVRVVVSNTLATENVYSRSTSLIPR